MRRKSNAADELFIKENLEAKSAEEISKEIDLAEKVVAALMVKLKKTKENGTVKRARLKANGQNIGAFLSREIADYTPPVKEKKASPHLYKSDKKE